MVIFHSYVSLPEIYSASAVAEVPTDRLWREFQNPRIEGRDHADWTHWHGLSMALRRLAPFERIEAPNMGVYIYIYITL